MATPKHPVKTQIDQINCPSSQIRYPIEVQTSVTHGVQNNCLGVHEGPQVHVVCEVVVPGRTMVAQLVNLSGVVKDEDDTEGQVPHQVGDG